MAVFTETIGNPDKDIEPFALRDWQVEVQQTLKQWLDESPRNQTRAAQDKCFLVEAVMGAGKTIALGAMARYLMDSGLIDNVLLLVPLNVLKNGTAEDLNDQWGLSLYTKCVSIPAWEADKYQGQVVLYQSLKNQEQLENMIGYWTRNGQRLLVLADEVHHGSNEDQKAWGEALKYAIKHSEISILLSGTFWRSDGHRIPGATYKATDTEGLKGTVAAHYSYNLDKGQRDGVVSLVFFDTVSGTVTYRPRVKKTEDEFVEPELVTSVIDRHQIDKGKALFTGEAYSNFLNTKHKFAEEIIRKCHEELHQKRLAHFEQFKDMETPPPPPAGLAIARDTREATKLQTLIKSITGHRPPVVHGKIEDEPTEVIERFKEGIGEWIVAVKMISEGTDIPRLKVLAYLGHQMTELVFHQTVGRIMRVRTYKDQKGKSHPIEEEGFAVVPEHPILYSFVKRFRDAQVDTDLGEDTTPCPKCGQYPCVCPPPPPPPPCPVCGKRPCVCPKTDPFIDSTRATKSTTHLDKHEGVNIHILNFLKSRLPGFNRTAYISAAIDGYGVLNVTPDDFGNDNVIY